MATCRDCKYCEVHVGYWICYGNGEKRPETLEKLEIDGMEKCSSFKKVDNTGLV